ncbi:ceramide glucosyltransferase-B-like isoform X2 [Oscarella lobularis]|uniref:ceramide glucosyltransferase-B-like isoform X2 n=1 Tax=Oscarella lobularis TaxID=121494 RepID=UPI003313DCEC
MADHFSAAVDFSSWFWNGVFFAWCGYILLSHIPAAVRARLSLHRRRFSLKSDDLCPSVTIVKPLLGDDGNLNDNLEGYFKLDYPSNKFEILFCVMDPDDPAKAIVDSLIAKYPSVDARLLTGGKHIGINPKINNMHVAVSGARHDFIWLSDSNIMVRPENLKELVACLDPTVGLVHQLPYALPADSFAALVDKIYFGTQHARVYLVADMLKRNCANGMSWLLRKSALEEVGGLAAFSEYLAEDFFIGKTLWERGWKLSLCSLPALQNPSATVTSLSRFRNRMIRWTRLRASMMPFPGLLEPLTECIFLGIFASIAASRIFNCCVLTFFVLQSIVWFLLDYHLMSCVENGPLPSMWKVICAWLVRELWTIPIFVESLCSQRITWGGHLFQLEFGGHSVKLE